MTVEERIHKLERTNRQHRVLFTLIALAAIAGGCVSAAKPDTVPDLVQAKRFEVVDSLGRVLVVLSGSEMAGV